jgi:hypothetical protein
LLVVGLCGLCGLCEIPGCGRVAFDARHDGGAQLDAAADARPDDAVPDAALPMAGLVALYSFETGLGDSVAANDGACSTTLCPVATAGRIGAQAMLFDGVDDCVDVIDNGQLEPAQLTLSIWARQDSTGNQSQVSKRVVGGSANAWQLETGPTGSIMGLSFTTYDGSGFNQYLVSADNAIKVGTWQHLAGTYDGATKRVYIDGVEVANGPQAAAIPYDSMAMKIGCDDNNPNTFFFDGALDDLRIYNRALTASEIAVLAAQ